MGFEVYKFTWSDRRKSGDFPQIRLDSAFVDSTWLDIFYLNHVLHGKISKSDHLAISFKVENIGSGRAVKKKKTLFSGLKNSGPKLMDVKVLSETLGEVLMGVMKT